MPSCAARSAHGVATAAAPEHHDVEVVVSAGVSATVASRVESFGLPSSRPLVDAATGVSSAFDPSSGAGRAHWSHGSVQPSSRHEGRPEGHQGRPRPAARVVRRAIRRRGLRGAPDLGHADHAAAGRRRRRVHAEAGGVAPGRGGVRPQGRHPDVRHEPRRLPPADARLLRARLRTRPGGDGATPPTSTARSASERAAIAALEAIAGVGQTTGEPDDADLRRIWRLARSRAHPDRRGGDRTAWDEVEIAARTLGLQGERR